VSEEDAAELAEAQADMRQLARDIAAGDVSPATLRRRLARKRATRKTVPTDPQQDGAHR
jgi:cyanophycinase